MRSIAMNHLRQNYCPRRAMPVWLRKLWGWL
jgi:hypothetical protein